MTDTITETDQERAARLEAEQVAYDNELAAAREAEGLDPQTALPPAGADDNGAQVGPVELVLEGTGQLSMSVGGKKATEATLRLLGGMIDVEGDYKKGDVLVLRVEAVVGKVAFQDKVDRKTNQVTGCTRQHGARIVGLSVLEKHDAE